MDSHTNSSWNRPQAGDDYVYLSTVIDTIDKIDSLSLTIFFLSNFTATYLADIASGQFSDRKIFGSPVIVRIWSLLSVINIDRLFVCLFVT